MSPGSTCVALWLWNTRDGAPTLKVVDPDKRLPRTPGFLAVRLARDATIIAL